MDSGASCCSVLGVIRRGGGGDIDLLVELDRSPPMGQSRFARQLRLALEDELGEQKVDLVIDDGHGEQAFVAIARETGVELWIND